MQNHSVVDSLGNEIQPGDIIAYSVDRGSLTHALVLKTELIYRALNRDWKRDEVKLEVLKANGSKTRLNFSNHTILIHPDHYNDQLRDLAAKFPGTPLPAAADYDPYDE